MSNRRIVLHIGSPKCGSTYLQRVLLQNADTLRAQGINYPPPPSTHPGNAADLAEVTAESMSAMFDGDIHSVVLSHEDLYSVAKRGQPLAKITREAGTDVQLLVFLRPFSDFVFGDYSQFMKQFFEKFLKERNPYDGRDFKTFAQRRIDNMQPAKYLRNWAQLFPALPIVVESHRNIRPALEGVLQHPVGIDWTVALHDTNPSLRMQDCEDIAAAMRDRECQDDDIRDMFRAAFHQTQADDPGRSEERIRWLERGFTKQNEALRTEFGFDNRHPILREGADTF